MQSQAHDVLGLPGKNERSNSRDGSQQKLAGA